MSDQTSIELPQALLTKFRQCTSLPSPPAIAAKIIELGSDPASDLGDVSDTVSLDPALSAKILRMANSPLYARHRMIENLRQAITLFGMEGTLNIALSFSLKRANQSDGASGLDYNQFWKRSLAGAIICQELGQRLHSISKDSLFLPGLLQDIGMMALDVVVPDIYKGLDAQQCNHDYVSQIEKEHIGCDHSQVGAWLLKEWNLCDSIVQPVSYSHVSEFDSLSGEHEFVCRCVAASNMLADIYVAEDIDQTITDSAAKVERALGIERTMVVDTLEVVSENFESMADIFDIDFEGTSILDCIMERARELLILTNLNKIRETAELHEKTEALEENSKRDSLTLLFNRGHFDHALENEFVSAKKHHWPLGLIFIDLDYFKNINDSYGHDSGDQVLRQTARLIERFIRDTDIAARYGGEEFVVLLPGVGIQGTKIACNRIVEGFRHESIAVSLDQKVNVTVSVGCAVLDQSNSFESSSDLLKAADDALYQAKHLGRNQFQVYDSSRQILEAVKTA